VGGGPTKKEGGEARGELGADVVEPEEGGGKVGGGASGAPAFVVLKGSCWVGAG